ncbi:glycosyltransferase family 2 protein, partial [Campylobacter jejuni]|nr:glycosyltransferase family 2 protein [Campylobacter jejuni]
MKTVGVVIPIYNVEKYLKECLDSVINQTYTNLEIILVNDGSTDENSLNIAKEYTLKDKKN